MAVAVRELQQQAQSLRARAGKQARVRKRKGKLCYTAVEIASLNTAVREIASPTLAQTAITLPLVERPEAPTTDLDEIKKDALRAYHQKQAELESEEQPKHILQIIKEQVEANNRKGYPYISLENAYAGYMTWMKQEEEEELEEWWQRREHEAAMRLRQDEARRAATRQAEIEASQQKINYTNLPVGRWHEREDDLDDGWW